ncbi:uncharacterized protein G2W53_002473 [Senna tora]|uniref:Uncharacterized protein n=1 Tax=Senna tora TaxID=362788 RepID=A0A834XJD1_9FABA|nr:uncharacterized protein G2W53_002473 [Senna tora]
MTPDATKSKGNELNLTHKWYETPKRKGGKKGGNTQFGPRYTS